jgi:hypothetical protein
MKIFISHSSSDKDIGSKLVQMLVQLGVQSNQIVFTSLEGYGIPKGQDIFDWLKSQLHEKPFVIYLLSDDYYNSVACLNEMGAAWMIESEHIFFFVPEFDLNSTKFSSGSINPRKMGVKLNDKEALFSFFDEFKSIYPIQPKIAVLTRAVDEFVQEIGLLKEKEEFLSYSTIENMSLKPNSIIESQSIHFYTSIRESKLSDEELLAFAYLNHVGKAYLLWGWQTEHETEQIREWEKSISLTNYLSYYYKRVIDRFLIRNFIVPSDFTVYNKIKEYSLREEFKLDILNFPDDITEIIDRVLLKYTNSEDLPF